MQDLATNDILIRDVIMSLMIPTGCWKGGRKLLKLIHLNVSKYSRTSQGGRESGQPRTVETSISVRFTAMKTVLGASAVLQVRRRYYRCIGSATKKQYRWNTLHHKFSGTFFNLWGDPKPGTCMELVCYSKV